MKIKKLFFPVLLSGFLSFCIWEELPFVYPEYFPEPVYHFKEKPLTREKTELGKQLFYDPALSADQSISCASCHNPEFAFSNPEHTLGTGINGQQGTRNAPALFNLAWEKNLMWDGSVHSLDVQAFTPITHPKEMGENMNGLIVRLNHSEKYRKLFKQAFGSQYITAEKLWSALAQFQLTLVSSNSKYDLVKTGKTEFSTEEQNGYEIFKAKCSSCHTEPLFTNHQFENIGLPVDPELKDFGKMSITKNKKDSLKFRTPSLRNLSYTAPYMHDGRFQTLEEVLEHYSTGIDRSPCARSNSRSWQA